LLANPSEWELAFDITQRRLDQLSKENPNSSGGVGPSAEKQAELERSLRAVHQEKLRAAAAIEAAGQILREWDTSTDESLYSGAMELILGIYPHELDVRFEAWVSLIHPDDRVSYRREIQRVLTDGGPFEIEYRAMKRSGQYTLLIERGYFTSLSSEVSPILSSMISDVSELRELEGKVRNAQRVEAFSQLTGGVAHDFNNMLSVVIGYAQILQEELGESDEQKGFLDEIEKAAFRASSLANQLLAFNKPPAVRKSQLQLSELLVEVRKMIKRLLGEQIEFSIEAPNSLWSVVADRSQIEQALINLAVGVREVMGNGGQLLITCSNVALDAVRRTASETIPPGNYVRMVFKLIPISGKRKSKAIEKSRSVLTAGKVIEQNGGHLVFGESGKEQIKFEIFLSGLNEQAGPSVQRAPQKTVEEARILLVEDDSAMRQFAKTVLFRLGHKVLDAADGTQALELLERSTEFAPDLLVTDLVMPRMGGAELAKKMKEKFPSMGILFISGYPDQRAVADQFEGKGAFMKKPFEIGELISNVESLLSN
jgi:two-component system, cell cycle sensor histidine kinase and response regulator CckA